MTCVFVDHGLLRKNEGDEVEAVFGPEGPYELNFIRVNAQQRYYEKLKGVEEPDAIYREEIAHAGLDRSIGQYFAALTNMRSVGVMGDERTYDYAIALRAVNTIDFMTAESAQIPYEVLNKVMSRIINEVRGVNRVMYDLTSKPPGTIEFE